MALAFAASAPAPPAPPGPVLPLPLALAPAPAPAPAAAMLASDPFEPVNVDQEGKDDVDDEAELLVAVGLALPNCSSYSGVSSGETMAR